MIFSPIAFWIGPWPVRWYGLAYAIGMVLAWFYGKISLRYKKFFPLSEENLDSFVNWAVIGIILGGRIGHIVLYEPMYYLYNPLESLCVWKGGMSFHGGFLGLLLMAFLYCKKRHIPLWPLLDCLAAGAPLGIGLGRIANFINQELYGRITSLPWGIIFPFVDDIPRHPSQLYEAFLQGFLLWVTLGWALWAKALDKTPGKMSGLFLLGYGITRWLSEIFREPLEMTRFSWLTLGQVYSVPLIILGLYLLARKKTF